MNRLKVNIMEYSKQFPRQKDRDKPKTGDLLYNGKIIKSNKSFNILQAEKTRLLKLHVGYKKELFKLVYHYGK